MRSEDPKVVIGAALGECVHVAGVMRFLELAELAGWKTIFLGPATPVERVIEAINQEGASLVGVSYRLTPETGERLLADFAEQADSLHARGVRFAFGGIPALAAKVRRMGFFERVFEGGEPAETILAYLKGSEVEKGNIQYPQSLVERIRWKQPFPVFRHHFGLPTMEATIKGVEKIADACVLDVISLGIDQDAQENFFHPERQNPRRKGAGGVPVRSRQEYLDIYQASRRGNFPLLRTYSGTDDFIRLAEMYVETIKNAWCAIPLFWFNQMDGRGPWRLRESIAQHQAVMQWYGDKEIPVELNEPHHWGMRDAPDVIFVTSGFLSAYNAKQFGVRDYIAQMMFNSPAGTSPMMDLAKMQAILELIEPLSGPDFRIWKQTRTGLLSYPLDPAEAQAHLAITVHTQMNLKPEIVHIVGHTEADHAAEPEDVIVACKIARWAIQSSMRTDRNVMEDAVVRSRVDELKFESLITLEKIKSLAPDGIDDPWIDPVTLERAVTSGVLDAPHLKNNAYARGHISTKIDRRGACVTIDLENGKVLDEKSRLRRIRQ